MPNLDGVSIIEDVLLTSKAFGYEPDVLLCSGNNAGLVNQWETFMARGYNHVIRHPVTHSGFRGRVFMRVGLLSIVEYPKHMNPRLKLHDL